MKPRDVWNSSSYAGILPDYSAIFMSSLSTKEECFERKIFGLPISDIEFVKNVKAGMILFLFEYERRELYGVFKATSDGGLDIVPHAYRSSGKHFPAQVHMTRIWHCQPLSESEFSDDIAENYFEKYKFNFGLSKGQVYRLLQLFSSRKVGVQESQKFAKAKSIKHQSQSSSKERGTVNVNSEVSGLQNISCSHHSGVSDSNCVSQPTQSIRSPSHHSRVSDSKCVSQPTQSITSPSHHSAVSDSNSISQPTQSITSPRSHEKLIITSGGNQLGDFIPLTPLCYSDTEDTRVPFSDVGSFRNSQMESDILDAYEYLNGPYFHWLPKLTDESSRKENIDSWECSDPDKSNRNPCFKSLCSDVESKRASVFSRLGGLDSIFRRLKKDECNRDGNSVHENVQIEDNTRVDRLVARTEYSMEADKSVEDVMDDLR